MVDTKTWSKISTAIDKANNILILNPKDSDGDSLGASLALFIYIRSLDKSALVFTAKPPQQLYSFLPQFDAISSDIESLQLSNFDLIICVDFADLNMLGLSDSHINTIKEKIVINIDHHSTNHQFGTINVVKSFAAATTEILYYFFEDQNISYDKHIATCLLAGIIYDTGSFAHLNTTQSVIDVSSRLLIRGARLKIITRQSLNKPVPTLKLWGTALSRLTYHPKLGLSSTVITQNDLIANGTGNEATRGIANFLNNLAGAKAILVLTEEPDNIIKGSLRTTAQGVGVSRLAELLGGGGHKRAAGFTLKGSIKYVNNHWQIV